MQRCKDCNRLMIFGRLSYSGRCEKCEQKLRESMRKFYEERQQMEENMFRVDLELIPSAYVKRTSAKADLQPLQDSKQLKYANITTRSKIESLNEYIALDVETCGLDETSPILEVSAIRFSGDAAVEIFTTLINPGMKIPPSATAVNQITDKMVKNSPKIEEIMPSLNEFVASLPLVGHNLPFDLKFLCRNGFHVKEGQKLYDTLVLMRRTVKRSEVENYQLSSCCKYYQIPFYGAHRSAADAYVTGQLFKRIVEAKTRRGV